MPLSTLEWEPLEGMPPYTRLSSAVVKEFYDMCDMPEAVEGHNLYRLPLHKWPVEAVDLLQDQVRVLGETGQSRLLEADAEASGTVVMPSTVPGAGLGVLATHELAVDQHILPFFGQLVYHDLQVPARSSRVRSYEHIYGADVLRPSLTTTARNWMLTGLQLRTSSSMWQSVASSTQVAMVPTAVVHQLGRNAERYGRPVWIVPSEICAGGRVNDPRPHLTANVKYVQRFDPVFFRDQLVMERCGFLQVKRTIHPEEELVAKYGRRYPLQEGLAYSIQQIGRAHV